MTCSFEFVGASTAARVVDAGEEQQCGTVVRMQSVQEMQERQEVHGHAVGVRAVGKVQQDVSLAGCAVPALLCHDGHVEDLGVDHGGCSERSGHVAKLVGKVSIHVG